MKRFTVLTGSFFLTMLLAADATAAKTIHTEPALKLLQKHNYWGETETIVSMHGVRINNKGRMKYSLVARSPDWTVTVFRDDDKTYISQSLRQFERTGLISGLVVKKYSRTFGGGRLVRRGKIGDLSTQIFSEKNLQFENLPLTNIATAPVEAVLYAAYKLPTNGGIPIRYTKKLKAADLMTGIDLTGGVRDYLKTFKIEHIKASEALFEVPANYTRCKSVQEVLLSKISREASGDFDELFEINNPSKKKK